MVYRTYKVTVKFTETGKLDVIYVDNCPDRLNALVTVTKAFPSADVLDIE